VARQHSTRIPTGALNRAVREALAARSLSRKGKALKIYYVTQPSTRPPTIVLFVNDPGLVHFSHERYLENRIRRAFNLDLTPLRFVVRESTGKEPASYRAKQ
jgi:GTP-binding protein